LVKHTVDTKKEGVYKMLSIIELQTKLATLFAPSGDEGNVADYINNFAKIYADDINIDAIGNLIIRKKGNGKKIMLTAHMDSIGVTVTKIEKTGFLRFCGVGAVRYTNNYLGSQVIFSNGTKGFIYGEQSSDMMKSNNSLFIDIGTNNDEDAKKLIKIGDSAVFQSNTFTQNGKIFSNYLDNRIGCAILMHILAKLKDCENDVYFVFSTQEEVGHRGIKVATQNINPDIAFTVDVTPTGDIPCESSGNTELGKGAAIKIADSTVICNRDTIRQIEDIAVINNIPHQVDIMYKGTDAGAIQLAGTGTIVGGISIPTRYIHNATEVADISDADACVELILKLVKQWE
jgi:endoglucanase